MQADIRTRGPAWPVVSVRGEPGKKITIASHVAPYDSMLTQVGDPELAPEIFALREFVRSWRFYDHFRTDARACAATADRRAHNRAQ